MSVDVSELAKHLTNEGDALDARDIAALIRDVPEELLAKVLKDATVRAAAVDQVIKRFPDYVDATRATAAVVAFHVDGERFVIDAEPGDVRARRGTAPDARISLTLDAPAFLRLVTSNADAAMLLLTGRLQLAGDDGFALVLASWFRLPGATATQQLDVTDIDPDAIARIVRDTDRKKLAVAMEGPARDLVLEQIFGRFPDHVRADKIEHMDGVLGWKITGGAEPARHRIQFKDGQVLTGDAVDEDARARVTIVTDGVTLLELVTGNGNPALLFLTRRIKVKGDLAWAAQMPSWFRIPSAQDPKPSA